MLIVIGGVERNINQVDTFVEYKGGESAVRNMTATDIFYGARADKLSKKVLQLEVENLAIALSKGNDYIELPKMPNRDIESFEGNDNIDKARNAEHYYARKAAKISKGARKWNHDL